MNLNINPGSPLGRRHLLAMLGSVTLSQLSLARQAKAGGAEASALIFDGNALVVAGAQVWRHDLEGGVSATLVAPSTRIRALAGHPARTGRLFAALDGGGLYRSDNGGRTWRSRSGRLLQARVTALAIAADVPDMVYATVAGDGLWRSEDAGESWSFVMDRPWIAAAEREVLTLASVNLASGMGGIWIYAGTERGLTRVPDCFCRWQDVVAGDAMDRLVAGTPPVMGAPLPEGESVNALASAHSAPELLYAALASGIWASKDGGVSWENRSTLHARALAIDPIDPAHIAAATYSTELKHSRDGGTTWAALTAS